MRTVILILIPIIIYCSQYVPLSGVTPGIVQGSTSASLQIELLYDPMCIDSANFDKQWVEVEGIVSNDPALKDKVRFRYIPFGLPYHITAHSIVQALFYIREVKGDKASLETLRYFFKNQVLYDQTAILKLTITQFMNKVAKDLSNTFSLNQGEVSASMSFQSPYAMKSIIQTKFILGVLGQCGAPRVLLNWNQINNGTNFTTAQWIQFLKKYA